MVIKQARIRESLKRDTLLQQELLMAKLVDFPDGEDTSHISVTQRDWMVEVERIVSVQAVAISTLTEHLAATIKSLKSDVPAAVKRARSRK
jgi:hypothetical protein